MAVENSTETAHKSKRPGFLERSGWDKFSIFSVVTGATLGLATIANNIRAKFYKTFVLGYGGFPTVFSGTVNKYLGTGKHNDNEPFLREIYEELNQQLGKGTDHELLLKTVQEKLGKHVEHAEEGVGLIVKNIREQQQNAAQFMAIQKPTAEQISEFEKACKTYREKAQKFAKDYRAEIETELKHYGIPSKGIEGWTTGIYKRWKELGATAKKENGIAFGAVAAISLGAVGLLRHNKYTLDRLEEKINQIADRSDQQQQR